MLTNNLITSGQQIKWFESLAKDKSRLYFVFSQSQKPIGMLYFTDITVKDCSWGCYIGEEAVWPGSGLLLEVAALDYAFEKLLLEQLNAEVLEFNIAPQKLHNIFGYTASGVDENAVERDGKKYALLKYSYKKTVWQESRERIISKLPKQIRQGVEKIEFANN